jgi:cell division protein FtsB
MSPRWVSTILFGVLTALFLLTNFGDRGLFHLWRLSEEKKKLDDRNFVLQRENEVLRERIYRLRHDDLYLEKSAREELGLARPGEIVYRFSPSEAKNPSKSER